MDALTLMAIVPAYNEAGRIGSTLDKLLTVKGVNEICVIDDGSTDGTYEEAKSRDVTLLRHRVNHGKGQAIKTGIQYFMKQDYQIAVFIDADGQHDPYDIITFRNYFKSHPEVDVVVASRFGTDQWIYTMPFFRKISNLLSRFGLWILYNGLDIQDPQNGYRAYSRKVLGSVTFDTTRYEAETEMLINAHLSGFKIGRIHIESVYEDENTSKFSLLMDTWTIPGVMLRQFFRFKPFLNRKQLRQRRVENH